MESQDDLKVKRNILLNPGPATTTDTVKYAQVVPDICPREEEFGRIVKEVAKDLVKIAHGELERHAAVLFCGAGTINMDACVSSLLPPGQKLLVLNNGAYSSRAVTAARCYHLDCIDCRLPITQSINLGKAEEAIISDPDIGCVYCCHHETGTGVLNDIRAIGQVAHRYKKKIIVDTTSTYAIRPIHMDRDNLDFIMASAQKGLAAMTGFSYVIGNTQLIEESGCYPVRSYYTNLFMQYDYMKKNGRMRFTPPVQSIYAARQAIREYWEEGEFARWSRHQHVWKAIYKGLDELGFETIVPKEQQAKLVVLVRYPKDPNFDFKKLHDVLYRRGFTIYPDEIADLPAFRLCALGAITPEDIDNFFDCFAECLQVMGVKLPVTY